MSINHKMQLNNENGVNIQCASCFRGIIRKEDECCAQDDVTPLVTYPANDQPHIQPVLTHWGKQFVVCLSIFLEYIILIHNYQNTWIAWYGPWDTYDWCLWGFEVYVLKGQLVCMFGVVENNLLLFVLRLFMIYEFHITLHNMTIRALNIYNWDRLVVKELLDLSSLLMASDRFGAKASAMYTRCQGICTWYEFPIALHDLFTDVPHGCIKPHCGNWPNSEISEYTISHNAPFRTEMCTFLFWTEHWGIWNRRIIGFVKLFDCMIVPVTVKQLWRIWPKTTDTKPQQNKAKRRTCAFSQDVLNVYNRCITIVFVTSKQKA